MFARFPFVVVLLLSLFLFQVLASSSSFLSFTCHGYYISFLLGYLDSFLPGQNAPGPRHCQTFSPLAPPFSCPDYGKVVGCLLHDPLRIATLGPPRTDQKGCLLQIVSFCIWLGKPSLDYSPSGSWHIPPLWTGGFTSSQTRGPFTGF